MQKELRSNASHAKTNVPIHVITGKGDKLDRSIWVQALPGLTHLGLKTSPLFPVT